MEQKTKLRLIDPPRDRCFLDILKGEKYFENFSRCYEVTVDFGYKEHIGPGESVPYNRMFPISEVHPN